MKISPKSQEQLQSQVAGFARSQEWPETAHLFTNIAEHAAGPVVDIDTQSSNYNYLSDGPSFPIKITRDDYLAYLRNRGKFELNEVQGRALILEAYAGFADDVQTITTNLPEEHYQAACYLGRGAYSEAYWFEKGGVKYVARIPLAHKRLPKAYSIDQHVVSSLRAENIPGMERIIAASFEDGVTISEFIPGESLYQIDLEVSSQIPLKHMEQLLETVLLAEISEIDIDFNSHNFLYTPKDGFTIIDSAPSNGSGYIPETVHNLRKACDFTDIPEDQMRRIPEIARPVTADYQKAVVLLRKLRDCVDKTAQLAIHEQASARADILSAIDRNIEWLRMHNEPVPPEPKPKRHGWLSRLAGGLTPRSPYQPDK